MFTKFKIRTRRLELSLVNNRTIDGDIRRLEFKVTLPQNGHRLPKLVQIVVDDRLLCSDTDRDGKF